MAMQDELRRITDLTRKHEVEIKLMQASQNIMNDQLAKLVTIQEGQRDSVTKMTTTLSNVAWVVGVMSVLSPVVLYIITK